MSTVSTFVVTDLAVGVLIGFGIVWTFWNVASIVIEYRRYRESMRKLKQMEHLTNKAYWEARQGNFQEAKRLSDEFWERMQRFEKEKRR